MVGTPDEQETLTPQCPRSQPQTPLSPPPPAATLEVVPVEQHHTHEIGNDEEEDYAMRRHPNHDSIMDIDPPPSPPPPTLPQETQAPSLPSSTLSRKAAGKKIKPLSAKQKALAQKRLRALADIDFQPFLPTDADVNVSRHERVLRLLGLWDFANLRLDKEIRKDLLTEMIAYYDRVNKRSFVKETRLSLRRYDFAIALRLLPCKMTLSLELEEADRFLLEEPGTKSGLVGFLLSWVVLVGEIGIIPDEAQAAIKLIESGQANKVDWTGLLWVMLDRDVWDAPQTGICYYASHLQWLMKCQKPGLFEVEEPLMEVPDAVEEEDVVVAVSEDFCLEKEDALGAVEPGKEDQGGDPGLVGISGNKDLEEEGRQQHWFLGEKSGLIGDHCLRSCSTNNIQTMEFDDDGVDGEVGVKNPETCGDGFTPKFSSNLGRCTDLLQGIDAGNVSFCPPLQQPLDPSSGEFLASPIGSCKDMPSNYCNSTPPLFRNHEKRVNSNVDGEDDDDDTGDDIPDFSHGGIPKRQRTDGSWVNTSSSSFFIDQALSWMEKAKTISVQKEQDIAASEMQLQYLTDVIQQKDQIIQTLERGRMEDQHRMQMQLNQFEHERTAMSHMLVGYQKALRRTRQAFAEYRGRFLQGVEPLYKDVPGPGGVVITTREFERQRLEKLEFEKQQLEKEALDKNMIIKMVLEFAREWSNRFETYEERVYWYFERFDKFQVEINLLKNRVAERLA